MGNQDNDVFRFKRVKDETWVEFHTRYLLQSGQEDLNTDGLTLAVRINSRKHVASFGIGM